MTQNSEMHSIKELQQMFIAHLEKQNFFSDPKELYEPIVYTMNMGGKRMRPVLMLMACELFGGDYRKALDSAVGLEIFHNFTLVHDDIMDNAQLRRGHETVYKKWNTNIAILSGDTMFALAFDYMMRVEDSLMRKAIQLFDKTAIEVCEGQQLDLNYETETDITIADYLNMTRLKTGVLIAASLKMGAIIAGASDEQADIIYDFGIQMGLVFQLVDDYLDVFSEDVKFGKAQGGDILANKKTFLYLKGYELATEADKKELELLFGSNSIQPEEKISRVAGIWEKLGVPETTRETIQHYHRNAMECLDKLALSGCNISEIKEYADKLVERTY